MNITTGKIFLDEGSLPELPGVRIHGAYVHPDDFLKLEARRASLQVEGDDGEGEKGILYLHILGEGDTSCAYELGRFACYDLLAAWAHAVTNYYNKLKQSREAMAVPLSPEVL